MRDFEWSEIKQALEIVVSDKKGDKKKLLKRFQSLDFISSQQEAEELFSTLEVLGYISNGITKEKGGNLHGKPLAGLIKRFHPYGVL